LLGQGNQHAVDKVLRSRLAAAAFAYWHDACLRAMREQGRIDQVIDQHHLSLLQSLDGFERNEVWVAGSGAD